MPSERFARWLWDHPRMADALLTGFLLGAMALAGISDYPLMGP